MRTGWSLETGLLRRLTSTLTRTWALALLWLLVAIYATRFVLFKLPLPPQYTDFNQYYVAAVALRMGTNPYLADLYSVARADNLSIIDHISNQTPTFLLCIRPLARFGPHAAYWLWTGISALALTAALWLLMRQTSLDARQALLFCALFLLYPPVYEHFFFSNAQLTISLLLVITIYCLGRGADRRAGLALALAAALKAFPVLLAPYLVCRGRWRALLWMATFGGLVGLVTLAGIGKASLSFLVAADYTTSRQIGQISGFFSINSMVSRLFWHNLDPLSPLMNLARRSAVGAAELSLFLLTISATARSGRDSGWRAFSLWVVAMILLSPIAEPHYLVMLMVPFAWIADAAARGQTDPRTIYAALASYIVAFTRYPLMLLQHFDLGSLEFYRSANSFWFVAAALAYLAAYWLILSERTADLRFSPRPAAAAPAVAAAAAVRAATD